VLQIKTMAGSIVERKMSVDYISFSAHTDYTQTSAFIRELLPTHIVCLPGQCRPCDAL
jgi:cleavage and polyadenylation specificity factor subunit 3